MLNTNNLGLNDYKLNMGGLRFNFTRWFLLVIKLDKFLFREWFKNKMPSKNYKSFN